MQLVKILAKNDDAEVIEKLNISNAHPLANKYFLQQDIAFKDEINELLSKKIIDELDINTDKIQFTASKVKSNVQSIGVCETSSWSEIDIDRLKYCYFYQLLSDCQKNLKSTLNLKFFEFDESQFQKLIFNVQKSLMSYLRELKKHHKINPKSLNYQIKENYTNQDCISLVYTSLIELLNFLYENYENEFDKNFEVPYYSEKINVNKVDEKIKIIQKHLKYQGVDPLLKNILDEQFERILSFDHPKRLTYHELDYFIKLLNGLSSYLHSFRNSNITADDIVSFLISSKFNNFKFIQYFTNEIRKDLATITDITQKRLHLLTQKKNVNQSMEFKDMIYDPNSKAPSIVFKKWIDDEINIVEEYISNKQNYPELKQNESFKLETSLSMRQLCVLIKTFSDCDVIFSKSQTDLARWICANFKNGNTENFSVDQARNHLYNKDPLLLEKVKDLAIEIVNVINERLAAKD